MTRAAFINVFKNHINIGGKNYAAYTDAALVGWVISRRVYQQPYSKQHIDNFF